MYRYNSAKKPRTRITYGRGKLSAFKSSDTEEEKKNYMHTYINPAPLCKEAEINKERVPQRREEGKKGGGEKRSGRRRRTDSRYDIASRYLNRLAATRTHCVKLISIFRDGRERVKNLERGVYVIPRQNRDARARASEKNRIPNRMCGKYCTKRRRCERNERRPPASKGRDIIEIIARA